MSYRDILTSGKKEEETKGSPSPQDKSTFFTDKYTSEGHLFLSMGKQGKPMGTSKDPSKKGKQAQVKPPPGKPKPIANIGSMDDIPPSHPYVQEDRKQAPQVIGESFTDPGVSNIGMPDEPSFSSTFATNNKLSTSMVVDESLAQVLQQVFNINVFVGENLHPIVEGLLSVGVETWDEFLECDVDILRECVLQHKGISIPLPPAKRDRLIYLRQLILQNSIKDYSDWDDTKHYTATTLRNFAQEINKKKQLGIAQTINTSPFPIGASPIKTHDEKVYDAWTRNSGKRNRSAFDVLVKDDDFEVWRMKFFSEVIHQKIDRVISADFDPSCITSKYDKTLWNEQVIYMWTVLMHVFQNPLGKASVIEHHKTRDARGCWFRHLNQQLTSPSKVYKLNSSLIELMIMSILTHAGSRVEFISDWFNKLTLMNDQATDGNRLGFDFARATLLNAVRDDPDLPRCFTDLKLSADSVENMESLKTHLLEQAALFDGHDPSSSVRKLRLAKFHHRSFSQLYPQLDPDTINVMQTFCANFAANQAATIPPSQALEVYKGRYSSGESPTHLPNDLYTKLTPEDKKAWQTCPASLKLALAQALSSGQSFGTGSVSPSRKAYFQQTSDPPPLPDFSSHQFIDPSILTTDTSIENTIPMLSHVSQSSVSGSLSGSTNIQPPPSSWPVPSVPSSPSKKTTFTDKKQKPKLSSMSKAHPAALLADQPTAVFDSDGTYQGYINTKPAASHSSTHTVNFTKWYCEDDDRQVTTQSPNQGTYNISKGIQSKTSKLSLIDRGANGMVGGSDCSIVGKPIHQRHVSITGIDNHQVLDIPICIVGAYSMSNRGPVILIFNEVAYVGKNQSIISAIQMEDYGLHVEDKSQALGGKARISTPDGYIFPLSTISGLSYLQMRPFSQKEYKELPHVIMTSDKEWDPGKYDAIVNPNDIFAVDHFGDQLHMLPHKDYDLQGECIQFHDDAVNQGSIHFHEYVSTEDTMTSPASSDNKEIETDPVTIDFWMNEHTYQHNETIARCMYGSYLVNQTSDKPIYNLRKGREHVPSETDYESLKPNFAWLPTHLIKNTFQNSTQYGFQSTSPDGNLFKRYHAPNPAMNVFRFNDDLMTDKIHSNTPAIGGHTEAQLFFGRTSHIAHVEPITRTHPFLKCLQNFVRKYGAPNRLLGDHAGNQASYKVMDYLRLLWIGFWCSEPYYQHQNMFERRYQTIKRATNRLMDRTNTPAQLWFLCLCYVTYVFNRVSDPTLHNRQPHFVATGRIADISPLLTFHWMEPVYYKVDNSAFPSESYGYWVGVAEHVGAEMTYNIWSKDTGKILHRSAVRSANLPLKENKRAKLTGECQITTKENVNQSSDAIFSAQDLVDSPGTSNEGINYGEDIYLEDKPTVTSNDYPAIQGKKPSFILLDNLTGTPKLSPNGKPIVMEGIHYEDLKGRTFLKREEDGTRNRVQVIDKLRDVIMDNKDLTEFRVKHTRDQVEDIIAYNDIMNFIHQDQLEDENTLWKFRRILSHQGPSNHRDIGYKHSKYNLEIEWENGEITFEPLATLIKDCPVVVAEYGARNGLLDQSGWKRLKPIARRQKKLQRLINQAKLRSFRTSPKYMYGFKVPRNFKEALEFDRENGTNLWEAATLLELKQLDEYDTFIDKGDFNRHTIPQGFKLIRVHFVYAVKHDGRHKARLVAGGHLTDTPIDSVYAGVVSLRSFRTCVLLGELNGMPPYATDIGNAYLEATTNEKVCIKAGPEFGERMNHLLIIHKALYGLRSSAKRFGDLLASCLREQGFYQSLADPQIFMRENKGVYEYIATWVDDLTMILRDPEEFLVTLQSYPYNFKLKGSGPISFHLGCGFERDPNGILTMNPIKYIEKLVFAYQQMFGKKPSTRYQSPLEENDHPELDTTEFLDDDNTQRYQSMIGALQWIISIGRWDVQTHIMTLSSFRAQPRIGHLARVKRIYGYLYKFKHFTIKF